ncbi:MAG: T9SS type A sorting domain-containing protein [Bacteroidota bacterium]
MKGFNIQIFQALLLMLFSSAINAQFLGGTGDGVDQSGPIQITLNGQQINTFPLYLGGDGDGQSNAIYAGVLSGANLNILYQGGRGDGFANEFFNGVIDGTNLLVLYAGGNGDGFDNELFDGTLDGTDLAVLYRGGNGDGFDNERFDGVLDGTPLAILYRGGDGDGFNSETFDGVLDGTDLAILYSGGDGDGFDNERFNGVIDGTNLIVLYGGGTSDGFDKTSYQGPLAINPPDPPLPVELLSFMAYPEGADVRIEWETAIEIDNDYFVIQRSKDTRNIEDWALVPGKGNGEGHYYTDLDTDPHKGVSYYRLNQVDLDGTETLTEWIAVQFDELPIVDFNVYPNPSPDGFGVLSLQIPEGQANAQIQVFDMWGRQLVQYDYPVLGLETVEIPLQMTKIVSGNYVIRIQIGEHSGTLNWLIVQP